MAFFSMQRDHSKKRLDVHHFESNGSSGKTTYYVIIALEIWFIYNLKLVFYFLHALHIQLSCSQGLYGQYNVKKPKIMKQSLDNTLDNIAPVTNSIPSPAASQMSNMSNPNKFIRIISGRDRGRKAKALKVILVWT